MCGFTGIFHPESISHPVSPEGSVEAIPSISNAARGDSVEFNCSALGGPVNRFTWTRSFIQRQVANTSQLVVDVEDASDGSEYECLVMNDAGNETATVTLNGKVALSCYYCLVPNLYLLSSSSSLQLHHVS